MLFPPYAASPLKITIPSKWHKNSTQSTFMGCLWCINRPSNNVTIQITQANLYSWTTLTHCNFLTDLSLFSGTQVDPTQVETLALCFAQNQTPCHFTNGQFYKHVESKLAQRQFYIKINLFSKVWKGFKNTSKIVCHSFPPNRKYLRIEAKAVSRERCLTFICLTLASELVGGWVGVCMILQHHHCADFLSLPTLFIYSN